MRVVTIEEHWTSIGRILLSGDYPFHRLDAGAIDGFLANLPIPLTGRRSPTSTPRPSTASASRRSRHESRLRK